MILKIPKEPVEIKDWMQSLKQNQPNDPGANWDAYVVWAGNKLPKYLWENWKKELKYSDITWQKFMRILRHRTDISVMWYQGTLPWPDFIRQISELIKGPIGKETYETEKTLTDSATMQDLGSLQLPAVSDWQDFERLCRNLWARIWNNPELHLNGRTGQAQDGVDIYGNIDKQISNIGGIQCKRRDNFADDSLTEKELREIIEEAKKFRPELKRFILAYTGKNDVKLKEEARRIDQEHQKNGLFSVEIFSWDDIKIMLGNYPELIVIHFPGSVGINTEILEETRKNTDEILRQQTQNQAKMVQSSNETIETIKESFGAMSELIKSSNDTTIITQEYNAELDQIKDLIETNKPEGALDLICALEKRLNSKTDPIIKFRILTNKAASLANIDKVKEAGALFIEAYQYNSEDEKAQCNRALGYFLIDQKEEAKKYAQEVLTRNPLNVKANEILIYCLSPETDLKEIISKIPKSIQESEGITHVIAQIAKERGDIDLAIEWLERSFANIKDEQKTPDLSADLASTLLQSLNNRFDLLNGIQITSTNRKIIERAISLLSDAISSMEGSETIKYRTWWFVNRSTAHELLREMDKALSDIERACQLQPQDSTLLKQKAFILHEMDRTDEAIKILKTLSDKENVPEASLLLAGMLFETDKIGKAISVLEKAIKTEKGMTSLQEEQKRLLIQLYLKKPDYDKARKIASSLRSTDVTNITNLVEAARVEKVAGNQTAYSGLLDEAQNYVADNTTNRSLLVLAEELYSSKRYTEAWPIYERLVDTTSGSGLVNKLIYSYYQAEQYEKALAATRSIPIRLKDNFAYEVELSILDAMGDLDEAIKVSESYLASNPSDLIFKVRWAIALYRKGDLNRLDEFLKSNPDYTTLPINIALDTVSQLAWLYAERNMSKQALEVVYWLRKSLIKNADAHMAYFGIFFNREKTMDEQLTIDTVDIDTAVKVEENGAQPKWWVIENWAGSQTISDLNPEDPIAKLLIGKKINDEIILDGGTPSETRLKIIEIKHKYVYALHETMEIFPQLFSGNNSLKRFNVKTNGTPEETKEQFQNIFNVASSRDEWVLKVQKLYEDGKITIGTFASMIGKNIIVVWGGLANNPRLGINCCDGTSEERRGAFELIRQNKAVAIDITALLTCGNIKQLSLVKKVFSQIYVPQSTIDTLNEEISDKTGIGSEGFMTISRENGQFYRNEVTGEDIKKQLAFLQEIKKWIGENCKILPVKEVIKMPKERREQLKETIGNTFLDTILLAKEKDCPIYSDDVGTRAISKNEFGVSGFWTQILAIVAQEKNLITATELEMINIDLIGCNYHHITISSATLVEAAKQANWSNDKPFISVLNTLSHPSIEIRSAVLVAVDFFFLLWKEPFIDIQREALVFAVLDAISRKKDKAEVSRILSTMVPLRFQFMPLAGTQLLKLITAWRSIRS